MNKMSLLLWSGGLDSTLVLHNIAKEARDGTQYHANGIRALTINQSPYSMNERAASGARKSIAEKFRKDGLIINYINVTIKQDHSGWRSEGFIGYCENPQALLWLTVAINYLGRDENLYTGYIRGDDYWHSSKDYNDAFSAIQRAEQRRGLLIHPLEWQSKVDVIKSAKDIGVYEICWWCEEERVKRVDRKFKPCGKCKSCLTHDAAEYIIAKS
jgi:7-cyano-7-deazaguanine synthase in queuosine biosynthesis